MLHVACCTLHVACGASRVACGSVRRRRRRAAQHRRRARTSSQSASARCSDPSVNAAPAVSRGWRKRSAAVGVGRLRGTRSLLSIHTATQSVKARRAAPPSAAQVAVRWLRPRARLSRQARAHGAGQTRTSSAALAPSAGGCVRKGSRAGAASAGRNSSARLTTGWAAERGGRRGKGGPSPGADVGGVGPVPAQMWEGRAQSQRRCGRGEPSPSADVGGVSPVPAQMWEAPRGGGRTRG
jgi:hypothetical protein